MATIPRIIAGRSLDPGGVVSFPSGSPVGQALEQGGKTLQPLIERYEERRLQQERFGTFLDFDGFSSSLEGEKLAAVQAMKPGAFGLHDTLMKTFDDRSKEWLSSVPEQQRPEFQARIAAKRESYSVSAAQLELKESQRFQYSGIDNRREQAKAGILQGGPEALAPFSRDMEELIDASTLSPELKDIQKQKARAELSSAAFQSLANRDPQAAQQVAKGWGVDRGFSGSAIDRTMQLLRDKEGFRSSTYWDVNADRVGYGSDTITDASGAVRRVQRGDTVTREDAERDLRRRTTETLGAIRSAVGDAAFNSLNPNQQAALGSVAYNYGKLPEGVVAAVRTGDAGLIAQSIEDLQNDNSGTNRNRRRSEAALARSAGGDGPVPGVYQPDVRFEGVPADDRARLAGVLETSIKQRAAAQAAEDAKYYNERFNSLQTDIIDGKASLADVTKAREEGWLRSADDILRLAGMIDKRDRDTDLTRAAMSAIQTEGFAWNQFDTDHKKMADRAFEQLGSSEAALDTVVSKTGIVPASAVTLMRGGLNSNNPQRVQAALQAASNMIEQKNPNIFAGVEGGSTVAEQALKFREYVYGRGMTGADAARKIMEEQTPEYQQKVKARIKSEDVDEIVRKNLKPDDIRGAFDQSFLGLASNPQLTFNPEMRVRAMGDYEAAFRDHYLANGDVELSKKLAQEEMKRTWGITSVNGSAVVMKYPPDRSPAYAGIEDPAGRFAQQATDAIKEWNGKDVPRGNLIISETRATGERYVRGEPPTYVLAYKDENGIVQTIPRQFYADPAKMKADQTAGRQIEYDAIVKDRLLRTADWKLSPEELAQKQAIKAERAVNWTPATPEETAMVGDASEAAAARVAGAARGGRSGTNQQFEAAAAADRDASAASTNELWQRILDQAERDRAARKQRLEGIYGRRDR
ncbi:hypothetical protein I6F09_04895 [Bradyrhizobium sp. IC3195]|uniref:lysozyme n=1 Tax=Bradyrhizobium sp. IC3195 TaxID=2793804 RepID=UPI001CD1B3D2|nr:hypothetical protein [Bradyrhizobium sp. IC3195]MCA1467224.1 hypothetical protein [Bradyrhizobium sp. IC3195]